MHRPNQGFIFQNGRGALNCSPEKFKESCQYSDFYEHHCIVTILGELNISLLGEDLGEWRRVIDFPLLKNEDLQTKNYFCALFFFKY